MKKSKLFMAVAIAFVTCFFIVGCRNNTSSVSEKEIVSYMNAKYEDTFTFSESITAGLKNESTEVYVKSASYPDARITVKYVNGTFSDNYPSYAYADEITARLQLCVPDVNTTVSYDPFLSVLYSDADGESLDTLLSKDDAQIEVEFDANGTILDKDLYLKQLQANFISQNITAKGVIKTAGESCFFCMDTDGSFKYANWR